LRIFTTSGNGIVDESGRFGSTRVIALRLIQFLAITLAALALVPSERISSDSPYLASSENRCQRLTQL
jgi:hypothetical protein